MPAGGIASSPNWWQSQHPITGVNGPSKPPFTSMPINKPAFDKPGYSNKPSVSKPPMKGM
jgi:hypothetical protein